MKGYFKNPELTKKVLDDEGWLKVGDLAVLNPNGSL
jgi:long-subunit acyl-CoA synthetase (AMP-forming)